MSVPTWISQPRDFAAARKGVISCFITTSSTKVEGAIRQSGPPQTPLMLFDADPEFLKGRAFCSAALRHGAFFHPQHNMFLSAAHGPADIDAALEAAAHGFEGVAELAARP